MSRLGRRTLPRSILFEFVLLGLILAGVAHVIWHFSTFGYLPQPFLWDPSDTFMDWFNPAYWSHRDGAFSVWRAIYPPLSFAILKVLSVPGCYVSSPFAGRDCDVMGQVIIIALYAAMIFICYRALKRVQPQAAMVRTLALALGLPGLFLLERGNLLMICLMCLAGIAVPHLIGQWGRALAAGVMINLKPYLLAPILAWVVRREWRQLEMAGFATVAVYLISWAIVGSGSVFEMLSNTANWIKVSGADIVAEMFYTTSYNAMFGVFDRGFPILRYVGSEGYELFRSIVEPTMISAQVIGAAAVAITCLRPHSVSTARLLLLLLLLSLTNRSPGGYSEILVVFLVFLESWAGFAVILAIVTAYLISIPYEWVVSGLPDIVTSSWLTGERVIAKFGIGLGQFLRPLGLLVILLSLSIDTIIQVTKGLRVRVIGERTREVPLVIEQERVNGPAPRSITE